MAKRSFPESYYIMDTVHSFRLLERQNADNIIIELQ